MPQVSGDCKERLVRYYYDNDEKDCRAFKYSGCGGNRNNFISLTECSRFCEGKTQ